MRRESEITLRVIDREPRPACGICGGRSAIELRGYTYCLHCTDAALECADISHARSVAALDGNEGSA